MWPNDPVEQEKLARDFVLGRSEHQRVDLKSTLHLEPKRAVVEMVRDISALANTDEDWSYIVIGAERGKVVGNVDCLSDANLERTSEKLSQVAHNYLDPVPRFRLVPLREPDLAIGAWGIIVIEPSTDQPYMFVRGFSDEKDKPVLRSGDWYVRRGDTTDLALPRDWARVLERRVRRALQPVELEVSALRERVAALEAAGRLDSPQAAVARAQSELLFRLLPNGLGGNQREMTLRWYLRNAGGTPFEVVESSARWRFTDEARKLLASDGLVDLANRAEGDRTVDVDLQDAVVGAGGSQLVHTTVTVGPNDEDVLTQLTRLAPSPGLRSFCLQDIHVRVTVQNRITKETAMAEADNAW